MDVGGGPEGGFRGRPRVVEPRPLRLPLPLPLSPAMADGSPRGAAATIPSRAGSKREGPRTGRPNSRPCAADDSEREGLSGDVRGRRTRCGPTNAAIGAATAAASTRRGGKLWEEKQERHSQGKMDERAVEGETRGGSARAHPTQSRSRSWMVRSQGRRR